MRVSPPAPEQAPGCADNADGKGQRDQDRHSFRVAGHPPPCHPGMVGPLPALSIVVTVAEAMVDCLLNSE